MHPPHLHADPPSLALTSRVIWRVIAGTVIVLYASYAAAGLSLDLWSGRLVLPAVPACAAIAWFYRFYRPDPWISFGAEAVAQILAILVVGTLITYPAASAGFPYRDAELHALDQMMGFDWRGYLALANAHPALGIAGHIAYFSMKPQTALIIFALVLTGHFARLQRFTIALAVSLAITLVIFILVPAVANFAYLGVQPAEFANLAPSVPYEHIRHLEGMRNGITRVIRFDDLEGMITFPSFHTVSAILFTWGLWGLRRIRWWILALNVMMIAATPIDGAHYAIDLVGGAIVAAVSIWIASLAQRAAARLALPAKGTAAPTASRAPKPIGHAAPEPIREIAPSGTTITHVYARTCDGNA